MSAAAFHFLLVSNDFTLSYPARLGEYFSESPEFGVCVLSLGSSDLQVASFSYGLSGSTTMVKKL